MKTLILTPTFFPRLTGNAVTAGRIARGLAEDGIECRVIDLSVVAQTEAIAAATKFRPDLIHGFHAFKSGRIGLAIKGLLKIPMIMTLTGTDLYVDLQTPETREAVLRVLAGADRLTAFNDAARRLTVREGVSPEKISVIPQSVFFPDRRERDFRADLHIDRKTKVCLLIGGIRRIKNFGYAFPVLEKVRKQFPNLYLLIAGGTLEAEEFLRLTRKSRGRPWIRFLGEVAREEVPALLDCADIVLNTSDSESDANAVMEALAFGKVVVGRHVSGNASLLTEGGGFLFRNRDELFKQLLHILMNTKEAAETGRRARRFIAARFSRDREQGDYLRLYRETADPGFGRNSRSMNHTMSHTGTTPPGPGSVHARSISEKQKEAMVMAKVKKGEYLNCEVCGLVVVVDEACGCAAAEILCCETAMAKGKPAARKKPPAKAPKAAGKAPVKAVKAATKAAPAKVSAKTPAKTVAKAKPKVKKPTQAKK